MSGSVSDTKLCGYVAVSKKGMSAFVCSETSWTMKFKFHLIFHTSRSIIILLIFFFLIQKRILSFPGVHKQLWDQSAASSCPRTQVPLGGNFAHPVIYSLSVAGTVRPAGCDPNILILCNKM